MHPVDTYGDSGAGYIEHLERIRVLNRLTTSGGGLLDRLRAADGLYPPGLHFLSAPASFLGDHEPASVTVLGGMWLLLLAISVAACVPSEQGRTPRTDGLCSFPLCMPSRPATTTTCP